MLYDAEEPLVEYPTELIDDNKVRAALRGMEGMLVDFRAGHHVPAAELARRLLEELAADALELNCAAYLETVWEILREGTGARQQLSTMESSGDIREVVRSLIIAP
jgi:gamma-glutamyl:cysteine ligase YbdK (ATP-grasp superfamily)